MNSYTKYSSHQPRSGAGSDWDRLMNKPFQRHDHHYDQRSDFERLLDKVDKDKSDTAAARARRRAKIKARKRRSPFQRLLDEQSRTLSRGGKPPPIRPGSRIARVADAIARLADRHLPDLPGPEEDQSSDVEEEIIPLPKGDTSPKWMVSEGMVPLLECQAPPQGPASGQVKVGSFEDIGGWGTVRLYSGQPLVCGATPFTTPLQASRAWGSWPTAGTGWNSNETVPTVPAGRITSLTTNIKVDVMLGVNNGSDTWNFGRTVQYYRNMSGKALLAGVLGVEEVSSGFSFMPKFDAKPEVRPYRLRLRAVQELLIEIDPAAVGVRIVPNPQARRTQQYGKGQSIRYSNRVEKGKLQPKNRALLKVMFAVLGMAGDAKDLWEVLIAAFPDPLEEKTFLEQLRFLVEPSSWQYFDADAFVEGFLLWLGQEVFYGRVIGSIENKIGQNIGASNWYGVGVGSRNWTSDPVAEVHKWLFS